MESSVVEDPGCQTRVRISNHVEVREVRFKTDEPRDPRLPGSCRNISSAEKCKKRAKFSSPLHTRKKFSLSDNPLVSHRKGVSLEDDSSFLAALCKKLKKPGPAIVVVITVPLRCPKCAFDN